MVGRSDFHGLISRRRPIVADDEEHDTAGSKQHERLLHDLAHVEKVLRQQRRQISTAKADGFRPVEPVYPFY